MPHNPNPSAQKEPSVSTDIATFNESSIDVLPPQRPPSVAAQHMLVAHAEMMQTAYELAAKMVRTAMVPTRFQGKAEDATAAILYGAELGLNPIQALQRVIPIHGMPSIEARTMVALLKSRGYKIRTLDQSDDSVTIEGESPDGEVARSTWTMARAIQAGYVPTPTANSQKRPNVQSDWVTVSRNGKTSILGNMKYVTDPQAMLKAKGQAEVSRDLAPDVLLGISYTREELESERFDDLPAPRLAPAPVTVEEILGDKPVDAEEVTDEADEDASDSSPEPETPQVDEPSAAQPTPDTDVHMASQQQVAQILAKLNTAEDFGDDDEGDAGRADWLSSAVEHRVDTPADLTADEAEDIIAILDRTQKRDR
jgi:hypothetical protein